jgi:hypothetical protein
MIVVDEIVEYPASMTTAKGLPGRHWCHMFSSLPGEAGTKELLAFAERIDLRLRWLQHEGRPTEHFDLTRWARLVAIKAGAIEVSSREYARARLAGPEALAAYLASLMPEKSRLVFGLTPPPKEPRGCMDGGGRTLRG